MAMIPYFPSQLGPPTQYCISDILRFVFKPQMAGYDEYELLWCRLTLFPALAIGDKLSGIPVIPEILYGTSQRSGSDSRQSNVWTAHEINLGTAHGSSNIQKLNGEDIITSPKTPKSNRTATIPSVLCDCLREYMTQCFEIQPDDRLFPYGKTYLYRELVRGCEKSGVKKIRVHDIRHSHASALVEMGFSPLLIAERLGHERIQTTMETCSHLYPNKKAEAARQFEDFMSQS